jgi:hypothetical protein
VKFFPQDCIVFVVDFTKNYNFQMQNEVQSMHWHSYQISILVHITYQFNLDFDAYDEDSRILTEYHFHISDDRKHYSKFMQHCFGLHWRYILDQRTSPRWHYVWSHGCVNQFKSSKPWYFVSRYPNMTSGCKMMWSFLKSGHGKGPHDGVGAIIK